MSTRTGEIGTYLNARRKKGGERRKDKEGEKMEKGGSGERERKKFYTGLHERAFHSAHEEENEENGKKSAKYEEKKWRIYI